jgi:hypothetical protein
MIIPTCVRSYGRTISLDAKGGETASKAEGKSNRIISGQSHDHDDDHQRRRLRRQSRRGRILAALMISGEKKEATAMERRNINANNKIHDLFDDVDDSVLILPRSAVDDGKLLFF